MEERNLNENRSQIYDGISATELQFVLQGYLLDYLRDNYESEGKYVFSVESCSTPDAEQKSCAGGKCGCGNFGEWKGVGKNRNGGYFQFKRRNGGI